MTRACLHMKAGGFGRVVTMSPPISSRWAWSGRTAYNVSKMGMTMVAPGVTAEAGDAHYGKLALAGDHHREPRVKELSNGPEGHVAHCHHHRGRHRRDRVRRRRVGTSGRMLIDDSYLRGRWGWRTTTLSSTAAIRTSSPRGCSRPLKRTARGV